MKQRYKVEEVATAVAQGHEHSVDLPRGFGCHPDIVCLYFRRYPQDVDEIVGDNLDIAEAKSLLEAIHVPAVGR